MLARLVPVLVCLAVLLSLVPEQSSAHAFLSFLSPRKQAPPTVAHRSLYMGVPVTESTATMRLLHPRMQRFIRDTQDVNEKSSAAMISLTDTGVLAGLNPRNGAMAWRRFVENETVHGLFSIDDDMLMVSSQSNDTLIARMLVGDRGVIDWEHTLNDTAVDGLPVYATSWDTGETDALIVAGGTLHYFTSKKLAWKWEPNGGAIVQFVTPYNDRLQVVSHVPQGDEGSSLRFTELTIDGDTYADYTMSYTVKDPRSIVFLPYRPRRHINKAYHANEQSGPHVAWLDDDGVVRAQRIIHGDVVLSELRSVGAPFVRLQDVGLGNRGVFLAHHADGAVEIVYVSPVGDGMNVIGSFSELDRDAVLDGGLDLDGKAYVLRMHYDPSMRMLVQEVFRVDEVADEQMGTMTSMMFQYDFAQYGPLRAVLSEFRVLESGRLAVRCVLLSQSGSVHMLVDGVQEWVVEHGLSKPQRTLLVPLADKLLGQAAVSSRAMPAWPLSIEALENESLVDRWLRHARQVCHLHTHLHRFARGPLRRALLSLGYQIEAMLGHKPDTYVEKPVAGGPRLDSFPNATQMTPREATQSDMAKLYHDRFGFDHVAVAASRYGKLYGIKVTLDGSFLLWARPVVPYEQSAHVSVTHLIQTRASNTLAFDRPMAPVMGVVAEVRTDEGLETHVYYLNPLTGEHVGQLPDALLCTGRASDVYVHDGLVHAVCASGHVEVNAALHVVRTDDDGLQGLLTAPSGIAVQTWRMPLSDRVVAMRDASREPVARYGRVRGDRSVLYKYLNAHARVVVTYHDVLRMAHVYVIDKVSGDMVYHLEVPNVASDAIHVTFTEHWITLVYTSTQAEAPHALVSIELYEREARGAQGLASSSLVRAGTNGTLAASAPPVAYAQVFALPMAVRAVDTTRTGLGVALRSLVLATNASELVLVPRRLVDPRRPLGKPTPAEAEERLMPYNGGLLSSESLPRITGLHEDAAFVDRITTSPALLESSSMVLATGVDWVYALASPSGQFDRLHASFNKTQLVLTIAALVIGIAITRPLVRMRALHIRW